MPLYVLIGRDGADGVALRGLHRDAHLLHAGALSEAGRIRFGGPLRDESGSPVGSVMVFEAPDLPAARAVAEADPYVTKGIFATWEVLETSQIFPAT